PRVLPSFPPRRSSDLALAFLETWRAVDAAGVAAVAVFGLGRDQVRHAKGARDRRGDERVGRGHDGAQIAGSQMFVDELDGLRGRSEEHTSELRHVKSS